MSETRISWYPGLSGAFEIALTEEEASSASHQGRCDDDVEALSRVPTVAAQLAEIDADTLRSELQEYGAWDADELADHDQNLQRILWIAANDIAEEIALQS